MTITSEEVQGLPREISESIFIVNWHPPEVELEEIIADMLARAIIKTNGKLNIVLSPISFKGISGFSASSWKDENGKWYTYIIPADIKAVQKAILDFNGKLQKRQS